MNKSKWYAYSLLFYAFLCCVFKMELTGAIFFIGLYFSTMAIITKND